MPASPSCMFFHGPRSISYCQPWWLQISSVQSVITSLTKASHISDESFRIPLKYHPFGGGKLIPQQLAEAHRPLVKQSQPLLDPLNVPRRSQHPLSNCWSNHNLKKEAGYDSFPYRIEVYQHAVPTATTAAKVATTSLCLQLIISFIIKNLSWKVDRAWLYNIKFI